MRFNPRLKGDLGKFYDYVILVEGKKTANLVSSFGFTRVYAIHETSVPLLERLRAIAKELEKRDRVCILTDFDQKGRQLYMRLKEELQLLNVKTDSTLRGLLLKSGISSIDELSKFFTKVNEIP